MGIRLWCHLFLRGIRHVVLKNMGGGIAYAIWSGMGMALITAASVVFWKQTFDIYAVLGIILIISGTLLITSKSAVVFQ